MGTQQNRRDQKRQAEEMILQRNAIGKQRTKEIHHWHRLGGIFSSRMSIQQYNQSGTPQTHELIKMSTINRLNLNDKRKQMFKQRKKQSNYCYW